MSFLTQAETNWKFVGIVAVLAIIACAGIWFLSTPTPEEPSISEEEKTADWQVYRNEELRIDFNYPSNWGELTLESKRNNSYNFNSSNKEIIEIEYYESRGILVFITKGTIYREAKELAEKHVVLEEGVEVCDYILKIIYQDGEIKTVYTEENKPSEVDGKIIYPFAGGKKIMDIGFQSNEKYMKLGWSTYAYYGSYLLNIDNGKDILAPYPIWNGDIYWSPNNKVLAVKSRVNEYGGDGTYGIFVSDYDNPEKLNKIFAPDYQKEVAISPGLYISDLYFIGDDRLFFTVDLRKRRSAKDYDILKTTKYEYITKTKELRKIEEISGDLKQKAFLVCEEYELEDYDPNWEAGWKERFAQPGPVYPIAFTGSEKKEVLGLCGPGAFGGYTMMFVLSNEGDIIFQKGPELRALAGGRYYIFEDITIIDIDGDGIEEIAYREGAWSMTMSRSEIHLYAPKYDEWMYVIYDSEGVFDEQKKEDVWTIKSVDYSENLERLEYQIFKKAFQQIIENIQQKIELSKGMPTSLEEILKEVNVWQAYRNKKYGFEIKYPTNYQIDWANEHDGDSGLLFSLRLSSLRELPFYYLSVRETEYEDIDVWFENWRQETEKPYRYEGDAMPAPKIILSEDIIIDGIKAKKTITEGLPYANGGRLNVIKDGRIYDFAGFKTAVFTTEEDQAFIDQVISTFRFLE